MGKNSARHFFLQEASVVRLNTEIVQYFPIIVCIDLTQSNNNFVFESFLHIGKCQSDIRAHIEGQ